MARRTLRKGEIFAKNLMVRYGITPEQYEELHMAQGGNCAICQKPETGNARTTKLFVDHCHNTGVVRGLLCHACNSGIGHFNDNHTLVSHALNYLSKFEESK